MTGITVVIPASNEERLIAGCLAALLASGPLPGAVEVLVAANGCVDDTVGAAEAMRGRIEGRGWTLTVLDIPRGGKLGALNDADLVAAHGARVYLDADVTVSPPLLGQLVRALDRAGAVYASGTLRIVAPESAASRAYARVWRRVPFMSAGVPGCGLFAVNAAGRARWEAFPRDIISDDTFARLNFAPEERVSVPATYDWPIAAGLANLIRVRRRQDEGVREIAARFPELMRNEDKGRLGATGALRLAAGDPAGFAVYAAVALGTRARAAEGWSRGR